MNLLGKEKSPYLLQHAGNPVHWQAWNEKALQEAKKRDVPIFLSIGYATCHWCHVMEKESFENEDVAKVINDGFVCIKVDREEHPEIDRIYMDFAVSIMGRGGWPLNVLLTPELKPITAFTYLPRTASHGLVGLIEYLQKFTILWNSKERRELEAHADEIVRIFKSEEVSAKGILEVSSLKPILKEVLNACDSVYGGLRGSPKFPMASLLQLFMVYGTHFQEKAFLDQALLTLDRIAQGGIHDHLGGGFARYSVDEKWLVPHFEKMLYENAFLLKTYTDAYKITKNEEYKEAALGIITYIVNEMTSDEGGF